MVSTASSWALVNSLQPDPQGNGPLCGLGPLAPGPEWTQRENLMKAGSDLPVCPLLWSLGTIPSSLDQLLSLWQLVPYECLLPGVRLTLLYWESPSWRVLGSPLILVHHQWSCCALATRPELRWKPLNPHHFPPGISQATPFWGFSSVCHLAGSLPPAPALSSPKAVVGSFPVHSGCVSYEPLTCQPPRTSLSGHLWETVAVAVIPVLILQVLGWHLATVPSDGGWVGWLF